MSGAVIDCVKLINVPTIYTYTLGTLFNSNYLLHLRTYVRMYKKRSLGFVPANEPTLYEVQCIERHKVQMQ